MEKRTDKNGRVYYYDSGRGIVSKKEGVKKFIKENLNDFRKKDIESLTPEEKRSYKAQSRPRYKGRFISKGQERLIREELKEIGEELPKGVDISLVFKGSNPFDVIKGKDLTISQNTGPGNAIKTGFKIEQEIINTLQAGGNFEIRTKNGDLLQGIEAINYLRELNGNAALEKGFFIHFLNTKIDDNLVETKFIDENESRLIIS